MSVKVSYELHVKSGMNRKGLCKRAAGVTTPCPRNANRRGITRMIRPGQLMRLLKIKSSLSKDSRHLIHLASAPHGVFYEGKWPQSRYGHVPINVVPDLVFPVD